MDLAFYTVVTGLFAAWIGWTRLSAEDIQLKAIVLLIGASLLLYLYRWLF